MCFAHWDDKKPDFRFYRYDNTVTVMTSQPQVVESPLVSEATETVRQAQEILRPAPEVDRQLQNRYDGPRYEYRDEERYFMELQRADLYRYGY